MEITEKDPGLSIKRAPDDMDGEFYNVFTEGEILDFDGYTIKPALQKWDNDFNRNFPAMWKHESGQRGTGSYPLSNIETKTVADFILNHKTICNLYPPGLKPSNEADKADMRSYRQGKRRRKVKPWTYHPQLGEEIGGINYKYAVQNPLIKFLPHEVEKYTRFAPPRQIPADKGVIRQQKSSLLVLCPFLRPFGYSSEYNRKIPERSPRKDISNSSPKQKSIHLANSSFSENSVMDKAI